MKLDGEKTIPLVTKNDSIWYYAEIIEITNFYIKFILYAVNAWDAETHDIGDDAEDKEKILQGRIKWDGCSDITFEDGYIHLCGKFYWDILQEALGNLYTEMTKRIPDYDKEVAE